MITTHLAKHLREVFFGGNWTWSNLKDQLEDVTWEESLCQVYELNTIAKLTYHIYYFVEAAIPVLDGGKLDAHDKFSFDHPVIASSEDWEQLKTKIFNQVEKLANLIEQYDEGKIWNTFDQEKYGNYYRNLQGTIEHSHYHLGQIAIIKKIIRKQSN